MVKSLPQRTATGNKFEPVPTLIRGVLYPSQRAAAQALGISLTSVQKAMDEGRLETVGLNLRGPRMSRRVCVNGVWYPSHRRAAAKIGMPQWAVSRLVARQGDVLTLSTARQEGQP